MRTSLRNKIGFAFGVGILVLLAVGILSYHSIVKYEDNALKVKQTQNTIDQVESMFATVLRITSSQRGYALTGDTSYLSAYNIRKAELPQKLDQLEALVADEPVQMELMKKLRPLLDHTILSSENIIKARDSEGLLKAAEEQQKSTDERTLWEVRYIKDKMEVEEYKQMDIWTQEEAKSSESTKLAIIAGSLFAVIFAVVSLLIIVRDLDLRKGIEKKLKHSEQLYRTLIDNFPDGSITVVDNDMRYLIVGGYSYKQLGFDTKAMIGKTVKEIMPEEYYKQLEPLYKAALKGESRYSVFKYGQNGDNIFNLTFFPLRSADNSIVGGITVAHDITEKKKQEEEIKKSEAVFRGIMENFPEGSVSLYDRKLRINFIGGKELEKLGMKKEMMEGKTFSEVLPPETYEVVREHLSKVFEDISSNYEVNLGDQIYNVNNFPLKDSKGEIIYGISISQNMTGLKNAEQEVRNSEALYRTIMENYTGGTISIYNRDLFITLIDGLELETLGLTREFMTGKNYNELLPPDQFERVKKLLLEVFEGKSNVSEEDFSGNQYLFQNVPLRNDKGEIIAGMSITQNISSLKQAEEELKTSEALYKAMMNNFPNGTISLYNKDLKRIMIGGQELMKEDITMDEVINQPIERLLPDNDYEQYLDAYRNVFKGKSTTTEIPFGERTYLISTIPIRNSRGEIVSGMSISQNITHIKKFEQKIVESRDFYLTLFEEFPALIWRTNVDGKCDYINNTYLEFTGRALEDELGDGWLEDLHPDDVKDFSELLIQSIQTKQPFETVHRKKRHDGEYRWVSEHGRPYVDLEKKFCGFIGSCYDITQRKEAEDTVRKREATLAQAQEIAHIGSWEFDITNGGLFWSDELYRIFGLDPAGEVISYEKYISLLHNDDRERVLNVIQNAFKTGDSYSMDHKITRPDGGTRDIHSEGQVIMNAEHIPIRMVGVAHDITEKKLAEEKLQEANKKLLHSEKLAALGRFSSQISHEIRNPLANISASSQLISSKLKPDPSISVYLDIIRRNTATASRIIKELLDFASPRELHLEPGNIAEVVTDVCELVAPRCLQNNVKLNCVNELEGVTSVLLNQEKFQEALHNFVSNAIEAMPEGGDLKIITANGYENEVTISVIDTGYGIPPENMEKIFEPFFTTKDHGTGLGVALAHQIIQNHNGKIDVYSKVGEGTTVLITIPLNRS